MKVILALGIVALLGYLVYLIYNWLEKKDDGLTCSCLGIIFMVILTIWGFISEVKSCAENDSGPAIDYYDSPRK